jgi:protein ImuB
MNGRRPVARTSAPGALEPGPPRVMVVCCPELAGTGEPGQAAARLFDRVIAAVTGFCPSVEAVQPGVCAFAARGPARYFGGETRLAGLIIAAVADLGVPARVGVADGLFAARLAARAAEPAGAEPAGAEPAGADPAGASTAGTSAVLVVPPGRTAEFLARQPVSVLTDQGLADQDLVGLLNRLGLGMLGDLAALSAGDLVGRFGVVGETAHRLARGLGSGTLAARPPAVDLSVAREFDPPEPLAEPVVFAAKTLAERMHGDLAARGLTCVRVEVRFITSNGRESRRLWRHDGLLSAAAVADRVRWQLDGWQLDGWRIPATSAPDVGSAGSGGSAGSAGSGGAAGSGGSGNGGSANSADEGIAVLRLMPDQVVRATGHQLALWGEAVVSDRVARAAMRVQAMLGHEAVLRPVLGGGRDVAERVNHVPFGEEMQPSLPVGPPWPGRIMGAAPSMVYPFAREADVTDEAGAAITVTGRCVVSAVPAWLAVDGEPPLRITGWAGPWPLSERWWDLAAARRRARFQLLTGDGRAWLAAVQDGRWLIEAEYRLWALTTRRCPGVSCGGGWPGALRASPRLPRPNRRGRRNRRDYRYRRCPGRRPSRGPSCTATPRSASSTGRPRPASWSPRPPGSGSRRSPSPTTTGCTGSRSSRRPQP